MTLRLHRPRLYLLALATAVGLLVAPLWSAATAAPPGLLLLHGWAGDSTAWAPVVNELGITDAAIDLPGHGTSSQDVTGWSVGDFARWLDGERALRNSDCLILGAHSNGSYVALEYARLFPERVAAIVVVEGSFLRPFQDPDQFRDYRARIEEGWLRMRDNPPGLVNARPETVEAVRRIAARANLRTALATFDMLAEEGFWSGPPIPHAVSFLIADAPIWTPAYLARLQAVAPNARFVRLGPISHYAQLDRPDEIARIIGETLSQARCAIGVHSR